MLSAVVGLSVGSAGCLSGRCRGVALAIELTPPTVDDPHDVLNFDAMNLSQEERTILRQATQERVVGCTRDDIPALENLIEVTAEHAGVSEFQLYYEEGEADTPAQFEQERYRAIIIFDTAESSGGPLGA